MSHIISGLLWNTVLAGGLAIVIFLAQMSQFKVPGTMEATGHGMGAALIVFIARSTLKALLDGGKFYTDREGLSGSPHVLLAGEGRRQSDITVLRVASIGKSGPGGSAMAQFVGFRFQVSGFGCQGSEVLNPCMKLN